MKGCDYMADEGSILSGMIGNIVSNATSPITGSDTTIMTSSASTKNYSQQQVSLDQILADSIDGSTRLIGAPHQFLPHNDNRFGKSEMGRMYAEKIIMEAPTIYIKPGVSEFLPGKNSTERKSFIHAISKYSGGDKADLQKLLNDEGADVIQYFGLKEAYSKYMGHVNMLCRMLATFLGIDNLRVPWTKGNVKFSAYDWRAYRMKSMYGDLTINTSGGGGVSGFFKNFFNSIKDSIESDYEFTQFYITPDSSYSGSFSNSTTSSVLENLTDQLSGVAKELQVVSSVSGIGIDGLAEQATSSLNDFIQQNASDGAIGTLLKRITGGAKQVLNGGNFVLPEICSASNADSNFSFKVHLVTPYGNKLAWYINVGVPLMFLIALVLPLQQTANVVGSPYLFQCFSPGWFTSSLCIMDSLSIEKASDGVWNKAGLPNDVTVSCSIKDLYSELSMPKSNGIGTFMANTGMLEFLMTTAGVNIAHQSIDTKWKVWESLFENKMRSIVQDNAYDLSMMFKHHASGIFKLLK